MIPGFSHPLPGGSALALTRRLDASPGELFRAFTEPALLRQWWGPRGFVIESLVFPAREGSEYKVALRAPDGTRFVHIGTFLRVVPPRELVYTWRWVEGPLGREETLVELLFSAEGKSTVVSVRHSRFASDAERDQHTGWAHSFERLGEWVAARENGAPTRP